MSAVEERVSGRRVREREELLELVDHEHQLGTVVRQDLADGLTETVGLREPREEVGAGLDGDRTERRP